MSYDIEIAGITYPDVPGIDLIDHDSGNAVRFEPAKAIGPKQGLITPSSGGGTLYASDDGLDGWSSVELAGLSGMAPWIEHVASGSAIPYDVLFKDFEIVLGFEPKIFFIYHTVTNSQQYITPSSGNYPMITATYTNITGADGNSYTTDVTRYLRLVSGEARSYRTAASVLALNNDHDGLVGTGSSTNLRIIGNYSWMAIG